VNAPVDSKALIQIDPYRPTGLEPPPPDHQYDVPHQMKKPLIFENRVDANDLRNIHNPGKYDHTLGEYVQTDEDESDDPKKQLSPEEQKKQKEDDENEKSESA